MIPGFGDAALKDDLRQRAEDLMLKSIAARARGNTDEAEKLFFEAGVLEKLRVDFEKADRDLLKFDRRGRG